MPKSRRSEPLRRTVHDLLEEGPTGGRKSRIVSRFLIGLIIVNLVAVALETVPSIEAQFAPWFAAIEWLSLVVFSLEYVARIWVGAEHAAGRRQSRLRARLAFVTSPSGIIDLVAVLPFWFALWIPADLRVLLVLRVVRFLKLTRYSPAMRSLTDVIYNERRALFGCIVIMAGATLISASVMYLAERHVQPDKFGTVPDAMWWAIVTLGTIGYGDVVPVTSIGKMIAAATIFGGLIMVALPVGIIATAFADTIHRRDFVVTWSMVAKVPLFSELDAGDIADIMQLLRAQTVDPGAVITRRGDPAHSMYFIAAGEVEIALRDRTVRLGQGHFFGEVAVLRRSRRSATAIALTRVNLLLLEAQDLHALMERQPRVAVHIQAVVDRRLGERVTGSGDIVTEEIESADAEDELDPAAPAGRPE